MVVGDDLAAVGRVGEGHRVRGKGDHGRTVLDVEVVQRGFVQLKGVRKVGRGRA